MVSSTKIIVRYAETDQMGIVHHSVYPVWYEAARTDFIKHFGVSYSYLEEKGLMMPLTALACNYFVPAHYEDELIVQACIKKLSFARILFYYEVRLAESLLGSGTTEHGFVSSKTFKPVSLKKFDEQLYIKLKESAQE